MSYAKGTFDPDLFEASALGRSAQEMKPIFYLYRDEPTHPEVARYWREQGVKREVFDAEAPPEEQRMFSVLSPQRVEEGVRYPLIYCLHGGGETAFDAEFYGYGQLIGQGECIGAFPTASLHGNDKVEREFVRVLTFLREHRHPVDFERVYVVGFSGGEGAVQRIAMLHPDKVAAIAPLPGPNSFRGESLALLQKGYVERFGLDIPMVCIGGSEDGGDSWPLSSEQCVAAFNFSMQHVAKVARFEPITLECTRITAESSENAVSRRFGLIFDETWIDRFEGTHVYFGEYYGESGHSVARIGSITGLPHTQCPLQARLVWQYIKCFSRNTSTGEIVFTKCNCWLRNKIKENSTKNNRAHF